MLLGLEGTVSLGFSLASSATLAGDLARTAGLAAGELGGLSDAASPCGFWEGAARDRGAARFDDSSSLSLS